MLSIKYDLSQSLHFVLLSQSPTSNTNLISTRRPGRPGPRPLEVQGETAQPDVRIQMRRSDALLSADSDECRCCRMKITIKGRPVSVNGLKATDKCRQLNANNPASWFRSFGTETTHNFDRNQNSCQSIILKPKPDRICFFHRFRCRNRNRISVVL